MSRRKDFCKRGHDLRVLGARNYKDKCKACAAVAFSKWRKAHPEKWKVRVRRWLYGIDEATFQAALTAQDHKCAVCRKPFDETSKPNVDHNHDTKEFRGLLCRNCNLALGHLGDCIEVLERAIAYLKGELCNNLRG